MSVRIARSLVALALIATSACTVRRIDVAERSSPETHDMADMPDMTIGSSGHSVSLAGEVVTPVQNPAIPAGAATVAKRLLDSPRHGEWAIIKTGPNDSVRAWVVYPRREGKAPVVVIIHEIYGESTWIRGVADQLAADGYIAIAPDLITGKVELDHDTVTQNAASAAIRNLKNPDIQRELIATAKYGMALPSAQQRYAIVGYCWGGDQSFLHAVQSPAGLVGAVVYYGKSPMADLGKIKVPVLAFYPGTDGRTTAFATPTDSAMKRLGEPFTYTIFQGADHGFLRLQNTPPNQEASDKAWTATVAFLKKTLGS